MIGEDVIVPVLIEDIVSSMEVQVSGQPLGTFHSINYIPGRNNQILKALGELDGSITMDGLKYPLVAVKMPIQESKGSMIYSEVTIPRIILAVLVKVDSGDVLPRFKDGGNFKEILYPMYKEFFKRLSRHPNVNCVDPGAFVHEKYDSPGDQPAGNGTNDYIDFIEILNLKLPIVQIKKCK